MKGIILVKEIVLVEIIQKEFSDWLVLASMEAKELIEYYPLP